jgi:hypothetical protein
VYWFRQADRREIGLSFAPSVLPIASGAALLVTGFAYDVSFAGLPYQDPTPEMQERWLFHSRMADRIIVSGAMAPGTGCVWQAVPWIERRLVRSRPDEGSPKRR